MSSTTVLLIASILCFGIGESYIFEKCEFANTLRAFGFPEDQISTWTCIANYESGFDTTAINGDTGDYGVFQISSIYWCVVGAAGNGCNADCNWYLDDDISDDAGCASAIFNEFQQSTGNGFDAWVTYPLYCAGDTSEFAC